MNGFLIIDKEEGLTSRDVDNQLMGIFKTKKIGHLGTLDPLASGVLVIAIGSALKVISLIQEHDKSYLVKVKVGLQTDTLDISGEVTKTSSKRAKKEEIVKVLNSFLGENIFPVPKYSAIKVAGKKLYQYARENLEVELPKKKMELKAYEIISFSEDEFEIKLNVSYGTYIRSIIDELGKSLGIAMTMSALRRLSSGPFKIDAAVSIEKAKNTKLISLKEVLKDYNIVLADDSLAKKISHGQILKDNYKKYPIVFINKEDEVIAIYKQYEKDLNYIKPHKIISQN